MMIKGMEKEIKALKLAVKGNFPALIIGETGQGKTSLVRHIAQEQGKELIRISLNGEVGISELIGKYILIDGSTKWIDGILIQAIKAGHWVVLDEINAALPEILFCLNSLLDDERAIRISEKDGEKVVMHEDSRIFATMNPPDEYVGVKELNKSLLSRFPVVLEVGYYNSDIELEIIKEHSKLEDATARVIVDVGNAIRNLKKTGQIFYTCSTRDLIHWANIFATNGHTLSDSFELAVFNRLKEDEKPFVTKAIENASDIKFNWQSKKEALQKKLTAELASNLANLEERKKNLLEAIKQLENGLQHINTAAMPLFKKNVEIKQEAGIA